MLQCNIYLTSIYYILYVIYHQVSSITFVIGWVFYMFLSNDTCIKWFKHSDYNIVELNNIQYIKPEKKNKPTIYATTIYDNKNIILEVLKIGKRCYFKESGINQDILFFYKNYGPFGFINTFVFNDNYYEAGTVILRKINPITRYLVLPFSKYASHFFPTLFENEGEAYEIDKSNSLPTVMDKIEPERGRPDFHNLINPVIESSDYSEKLDWITKYCEQMYAFVYATFICRKSVNKYPKIEEGVYMPYDVCSEVHYDRIHPINYEIDGSALFSSTEPSRIILKPNSLISFIDLLLIQYATSENTPLKICKHCFTAFIAENVRSEFCSPKCRNQYNVYKSRKKSNL